MAKKNASDLGDHIVAAAREAVAVARGEMRPARVRRIPITVRKAKAAPAERERVVEMLLSSVDTSLLFEDEWAEEADRRAEEIRRGSVRPVSGPDVLRAALDRLKWAWPPFHPDARQEFSTSP